MTYYRIRHFGHDGKHYYLTGTRATGEPIWGEDPVQSVTFSTKQGATRMAQRLTQDGYDVDIV